MTRINQVFIIVLALTVQVLALPQRAEAKGPPARIYSSSPAAGVQGEAYSVTLIGDNFEDAVPEVRYIHALTGKVAPNSKMGVSNPNFVSPNEIGYTLTIASDADLGDYYIEIYYISGRKGKGTTTLFAVQSKNSNTETVNCAPFTYPDYDPEIHLTEELPPGRCDCMFQVNNQSGDSGTPPGYIFNLIDDCETGETLVIPQFGDLNSLGATTNDEADRRTIYAVNGNPNVANEENPAPFDGTSIIAAAGHRAHIRHMNITVGQGVTAGCNGGIETAVRFVLDSGSPDPTAYDAFYRHTRWWVQTIHVDSLGDPLCIGFEFRRDPSYTDAPNTAEAYDALVDVSGWVMENSYEKIGVLYEGFHWKSGGNTNPELKMFQVDPPAQSGYLPIGIAVGGITSSDPSALVTSVVQENTVNLGGTGVGILVYGAETYPLESMFRLDKNTISGVEYGILVDSNVEHINFSGNTLLGDGNNTTNDIPICTKTSNWDQKGKPDKISGWSRDGVSNNTVMTSDCPPTP